MKRKQAPERTEAEQAQPREIPPPRLLVQLDGLTRDYGGHRAVDDLNLVIDKGEVLGLLGPNGAGKSTTLQMISGNLAPSAGRITINGVDLLEQPRAAKAHIGYLPENPPLYRELTVDEYLTYCARLHRIPRAELGSALATAKRRCGLEAMAGRLIGNLSKGYQQRVGIAQAIIHTPPVVILDEPTVGLDPIQIREIRALIRELGESHSVILSTHILPEVLQVCSRVEIIHQGRLVFSDTIAGLEARTTASTTLLALRHPPAAQELTTLPDIIKAEALGAGRFRLHHTAEGFAADEFIEHAVAAGWGITELTPERVSLEQIFIELTAGDSPADDAEAAA
ncbi:MAG: ABC transporter ATP-binding protein [Proteobacteria bacterium]|nr:MAG: ABC transporter ATP-binding protein [Pseudomonadota bacterium]QKK10390.1 MAG: ABC transporter ATP-binding protein [Pseudomonadota bacterium]